MHDKRKPENFFKTLCPEKHPNRLILIMILAVGLLFSCNKSKGFFGFGPEKENIRTYRTLPVFKAGENLFWVYQLKSTFKPNLFGIKLERNDLGWLNLDTHSLVADPEFNVLSHNYPQLKPGQYRITIFHNLEELDMVEFRVIE